jgi:hypothetical protein
MRSILQHLDGLRRGEPLLKMKYFSFLSSERATSAAADALERRLSLSLVASNQNKYLAIKRCASGQTQTQGCQDAESGERWAHAATKRKGIHLAASSEGKKRGRLSTVDAPPPKPPRRLSASSSSKPKEKAKKKLRRQFPPPHPSPPPFNSHKAKARW